MFTLANIMKEKNMTSQALADKTSIPKQTIDQYRSGRRKGPSFANGLEIADVLGVNPHRLLNDTQE